MMLADTCQFGVNTCGKNRDENDLITDKKQRKNEKSFDANGKCGCRTGN